MTSQIGTQISVYARDLRAGRTLNTLGPPRLWRRRSHYGGLLMFSDLMAAKTPVNVSLGSRRDCFTARWLRVVFLATTLAWLCAGRAAAQMSFDPATYPALVPASSSESLPVGTRITLANWTQYKKFLPIGVQALFSQKYLFRMGSDPGFAIEVGPTVHIPVPSKVVRDTEKYSGQVRLKDVSSGGKAPEGYVAGEAFPNPSAPDRAYKIIYHH